MLWLICHAFLVAQNLMLAALCCEKWLLLPSLAAKSCSRELIVPSAMWCWARVSCKEGSAGRREGGRCLCPPKRLAAGQVLVFILPSAFSTSWHPHLAVLWVRHASHIRCKLQRCWAGFVYGGTLLLPFFFYLQESRLEEKQAFPNEICLHNMFHFYPILMYGIINSCFYYSNYFSNWEKVGILQQQDMVNGLYCVIGVPFLGCLGYCFQ